MELRIPERSTPVIMPPFSRFDMTTRLEYNAVDTSSSHSTFEVNKPIKQVTLQIARESCPEKDVLGEKRRVSFDPNSDLHSIEGVEEYSDEEKTAVWFTVEEIDEMRKQRRATIKLMESANKFIDDEKHYFRGLEFKTREGYRRKQWNIIEAAMVVFDEQINMQYQPHNNNGKDVRCTLSLDEASEGLSEAYRASTSGARDAAIKRATHDRIAADMLSTAMATATATLAPALSTKTDEGQIRRQLSQHTE